MLIAATLLISQHNDVIRSRIKLLIWKNRHPECHRFNSYEALPPLALHLLKHLSLLSSIFLASSMTFKEISHGFNFAELT